MWIPLDPTRDALLLDIDGTLLDIAPTAKAVVMPAPLAQDLRALYAKLGGALGYISGRRVADIDRLMAPLRTACCGAHGAEWRLAPKARLYHAPVMPTARRKDIVARMAGLSGVWVEDKGCAVAVHFRQAPQHRERVEQIMNDIAAKMGGAWSVLQGRKVFELVRQGYDKGRAVEMLMSVPPFAGRRPVFIGDDITDIAAAEACKRVGGRAGRVGTGPSSAHDFPNPKAVRAWIHEMAVCGQGEGRNQ